MMQTLLDLQLWQQSRFLGLLIQSTAQMLADSDRKMSMKLRPPTALVSDSVTVLQQEDGFNGRTRKDAPGGAARPLLQSYRFQCLWSHIRDLINVRVAGCEPGAADWGSQAVALSRDTALGGGQNGGQTVQACKAHTWHARPGREQESDSRWCPL